MNTKHHAGLLSFATAAAAMYLAAFWSAAEPSIQSASSEALERQRPRAPEVLASTTRNVARPAVARLRSRGTTTAPAPRALPYHPIAGARAAEIPSIETARAGAPRESISIDQLESDQDFLQLTAAMRRTSSAEANQKQLEFLADFAAISADGHEVSLSDLTCDEHDCIGQLTAQQHEDIEAFMLNAAKTASNPIYTYQQVELIESTQPTRRFAISIDPNHADLPLLQ